VVSRHSNLVSMNVVGSVDDHTFTCGCVGVFQRECVCVAKRDRESVRVSQRESVQRRAAGHPASSSGVCVCVRVWVCMSERER